jgi:adenosylcobinamide-GDP ribazoletransferase
MLQSFRQFLQQFGAAIVFYTIIPLPQRWPFEFRGMARWSPLIGLLIGIILVGWDGLLHQVGVVPLLRDVLIVTLWLGITGGLHFDGVMDTADGLAVMDRARRLAVMSDSRTGAFGVMAAIVVFSLKVAALSGLTGPAGFGGDRAWVLLAACGWGRWGQLAAIVRHPYLKPTGSGAIHKTVLTSPWQAVPLLGLMLGLSGLLVWLHPEQVKLAFGLAIGGGAIGLLLGDWFNHELGGQTGDTYGAIVEWTEVGVLVLANLLNATHSG